MIDTFLQIIQAILGLGVLGSLLGSIEYAQKRQKEIARKSAFVCIGLAVLFALVTVLRIT